VMLDYLRLVYFTRENTKDAGFIETDHFGVRFRGRGSHLDLTGVSQRWLRDLLWNYMADRLTSDPPRSRTAFDYCRRGCVELSAFLEAQAPGGGHDPTALTNRVMTDFVVDQRHRARHGLRALGIHAKGRGPDLEHGIVTAGTISTTFNGARRVLRAAHDSGEAERIGLPRAFIVALPAGGHQGGRRRPFPDDVARALADESNLRHLESFDIEDRGLRDIWEALVTTGRRCSEVLEVRMECIGRLNQIPLFWHDQTKVGNYDEGIRIPERLFQRIQLRQEKTAARFHQRHGRVPNPQERLRIALFPRRHTNRDMRKGSSYGWFHTGFRDWVDTLEIAHCVPHQARHTLATKLLAGGANLTHVKRYLGHVSERMAEHYVHLANTDPRLEDALNAVWVAGPGSAAPGALLSGREPMTREEAEALVIDLTRRSTPAEGGFCTFQPVVNGDACPWKLNCHGCDKFVMSGADLVYWQRKREHWRMLAERAPDGAIADYLHEVFEPTARAIAGLEVALEAVGLLDQALQLDLRRPQDYFGRVWSTAFRAQELARREQGDVA
jgi:integrase